jgi:hypothetical protein
MANDKPTAQTPASVTLRIAEIHSLCDRLRARALSVLLRDEPEQARDLTTAAAVIVALLRNVNSSDTVTVENGA